MFVVWIYIETKSAFKKNRILRDNTHFLPQFIDINVLYVFVVYAYAAISFLKAQNSHQHKDQGGFTGTSPADNSQFLLAFHSKAKILYDQG